jgi:hypothetical protein
MDFTHPDPGKELDWLATDVNGRIGLFSTGGDGPMPEAVVEHLLQVKAALDRLVVLPGPRQPTLARTPEGVA